MQVSGESDSACTNEGEGKAAQRVHTLVVD